MRGTYAIVPLLIWAALRFEQRGTTAALLLVAVDRGDRDRVGGQLLRGPHAARAPADDRLLHGRHGHQHADAGRRAGRAARRDRRPRRIHLDRVARAQDAAHRAEAAVGGGDPHAAAAGAARRGRRREAGARAGRRRHDDRPAGQPRRRSARRVAADGRAARAAPRGGRARRSGSRRRGPAARAGRGDRFADRGRDSGTDRRALGSQPPRADRDQPAVERDQVRRRQADPSVRARRERPRCASTSRTRAWGSRAPISRASSRPSNA